MHSATASQEAVPQAITLLIAFDFVNDIFNGEIERCGIEEKVFILCVSECVGVGAEGYE